MALWRVYYHLIWATKERLPLITEDIDEEFRNYIIGKADSLQCITHAVGNVENHVHLVVSIPPKLSVSEFVKNIKGSVSHHVNHNMPNYHNKFAWQRGYGVFSLGQKQLDKATDYAASQKQRHLKGNLIPLLERIEDEDDGPSKKLEKSEIAEEVSPWPATDPSDSWL